MADIMHALESLTLALNDSITSGTFSVTLEGQVYFADPESFGITSSLICQPGEQSRSLFCRKETVFTCNMYIYTYFSFKYWAKYYNLVNCPPGTYGDGETCIGCQIGSYQDTEGQEQCMTCPEGQTTRTTYSDSSEDCIDGKIFNACITTHRRVGTWINVCTHNVQSRRIF